MLNSIKFRGTLALLVTTLAGCALERGESGTEPYDDVPQATGGKADGIDGIVTCETHDECDPSDLCLRRHTLPRSIADALTANGLPHTPGTYSGICRPRLGRTYGVEHVGIRTYRPGLVTGAIRVQIETNGAVQMSFDDGMYVADYWDRVRDGNERLADWSFQDAYDAIGQVRWPVDVPVDLSELAIRIYQRGFLSNTHLYSYSSNVLPRIEDDYFVNLRSSDGDIRIRFTLVPNVGPDEEAELLSMLGG